MGKNKKEEDGITAGKFARATVTIIFLCLTGMFVAVNMIVTNEPFGLIKLFIDLKPWDRNFFAEKEEYTGLVIPEDETVVFTNESGETETAVMSLSELQGASEMSKVLKGWSENGMTPMHDDSVLNILLIGVDQGGGNADSLILCSVDTVNGKITLSSVMRDCYTYIGTDYGDLYAKINSSYYNGGSDLVVKTIEKDFKVDIDYYVKIYFDTFIDVINALGGLRVNVMQYEADWITYDMLRPCPSGDNVLLDGEQAFVFCRMRYCDTDGDVSRTRRQRDAITSLINSCRELDAEGIYNVVNLLLPYVRTDCPTDEIMSLAYRAVTEKWYDFYFTSFVLPYESARVDYNGFAWIWIVDYPHSAAYLQKSIYGRTEIADPDSLPNAIKTFYENGFN